MPAAVPGAINDVMDAILATLDAAVPDAVRAVCQRLRQAGHQAVCVGGAVRDALLGRAPGDWDVATSATPAEVQKLFRKTIPTGIQHGTVTVMEPGRSSRGEEGQASGDAEGPGRRPRMRIEVTTFRGEGAYSDGRRPDTVTFGVPLHEDLARRDFVINAIAYDPVDHALIDPFGGRDDLAARRVRAVGEAQVRFDEDGLRVMRAVRFAAQLDFALDADTEAAIPGALARLGQVSWERVRDELVKILRAPRGTRGLEIARRTGILAQVLPELVDLAPLGAGAGPAEALAGEAGAAWQRALARVDAIAAEDPVLRLAALLWELAPGQVDAAMRRLKASNADRARVLTLVSQGAAWSTEARTDAGLRRLLGRAGRERAGDLVALWHAEAQACTHDPDRAARLEDVCARARRIMAAGDALTVADLSTTGGDLMRILGIPPGRIIGRLLDALLERVLEDPSLDTPERLAELAPALHAALVAEDPGTGSGSRGRARSGSGGAPETR
jgi:tRNA nucleotidyltransferase (CCA-adding enzyme)